MESPSNLEFTVRVSYMEIYMEKVRDLLNRKFGNVQKEASILPYDVFL